MNTKNHPNAAELEAALSTAAHHADKVTLALRRALSALHESGTCANLAAAQIMAHIETAAKLAAALRNAPDGEEGGK